MNILTIIPAYNEEKTIEEVIRRTKKYTKDILVIDDGSTDSTWKKLNKIKGIYKIRNTINKGKGSSLKRGFKLAIDKGYEGVITIDADLQHDPALISQFVKKSKEENIDILVGARRFDVKQMPLIRKISNKLSSFFISIACNQRIPDSQSGYRYINTNTIKKINLKSEKYNIETEMLIKASRRKLNIGFIAIPTNYHHKRKFPIKDTLIIIKDIIKYLLFRK